MTSGTLCFGLVLIMYCPGSQTVTSEFCKVYPTIRVHPSHKDTLDTRRYVAIQEQLYKEKCLKK